MSDLRPVTGISANATVADAVPLEDNEANRSRRAAEEAVEEGDTVEDEDTVEEDVEEKCRVEMWRCLSKVVEEGLHYMDKPDGLLSLAKKTMFKMAFHGGLSNVWSGVMTIPEVNASLKLNTDVACTLQIKPPAF